MKYSTNYLVFLTLLNATVIWKVFANWEKNLFCFPYMNIEYHYFCQTWWSSGLFSHFLSTIVQNSLIKVFSNPLKRKKAISHPSQWITFYFLTKTRNRLAATGSCKMYYWFYHEWTTPTPYRQIKVQYNTVNDLINGRDICLFLGLQTGALRRKEAFKRETRLFS